jgi:hypothetical protein
LHSATFKNGVIAFTAIIVTVLPDFAGSATVCSITEVTVEKAEVCFVHVKKNWKEELQWIANGEFTSKFFFL